MRLVFRIQVVLLLACVALRGADMVSATPAGSIDREALVGRHAPSTRGVVLGAPFSVGNGGFAFTVDATGLQTFGAASYEAGFPLETLARWAWAEDPNDAAYTLTDASRDYRLADGRRQAFPTEGTGEAGRWLRMNPRQHPLAEVALVWTDPKRGAIRPEDLQGAEQRLDLWTGTVHSRYELAGQSVEVRTQVDPLGDRIAVVLDSPWAEKGLLGLEVRFPRGHDMQVKNTPALDWSEPETHQTRTVDAQTLVRRVPGLDYQVRASRPWQPSSAPHVYQIYGYGRRSSFVLEFAPTERRGDEALPGAEEIAERTRSFWSAFWRRSAALDLSGSVDPRSHELERRVVLSQYLTALQSVGEMPPQESGLTCNTWYGKHHTEMVWWHVAHFAAWGQRPWLEKNLKWYLERLPEARRLAASRSLDGARWAKMVDPDGRESPGVNPLIIWNQPHPIALAEIVYRQDAEGALDRYATLVEETAAGLASMATWDEVRGEYVLGPPIFIAQEIHDPALCQNPGFELTYWYWALGVAQNWRERRGLSRDAHWDDIRRRLARPAQREGKYVAVESIPDTWSNRASRHDHPQMLMGWGFLPANDFTDRAVMERTFAAVLAEWDWETKIWGWDYPMMAMTALRLDQPETAITWLLKDGPNNRYLANGHCPQSSDMVRRPNDAGQRPEIAAYLPANGGLLATVGMMVAGWEGAKGPWPGFPRDGRWTVRAEGWQALP